MSTQPVRRRLALYVSGFDPQGPAHYHRLYREQAALQSQVSGHSIEVGRRQRVNAQIDAWDLQARIEGQDVQTRYEFLRWDDIVRTHWHAGHWRYLAMTVGSAWRCLRDGSWWKTYQSTWVGAMVCINPFIVLLFNLLLALLLLGLVGVAWAWGGPTSPWFALALGLALAGGYGIARLSRHGEHKWFMGWTIRSYWFTTRQGRGQTPDLDERLDQHAAYLLQALQDPGWDEVLLIGHSSGAMMATIIAGRAAQRAPQALGDPRFAMVTLGQCFPILSFQPQATGFRREIRALALALGERWIDFTAPADRCCTALVDPAAGVRGMDGVACPSPKVLSTRVSHLFAPDAYAQLRRQLFDLHFHYIKATQLPGLYDYFAITAGPQTLTQRFASQPAVRNWRQFERLGGPFRGMQGS